MIQSGKVIAANTDLDCAQAFILSSTDFSLGVLVSASGDDIFTRVRQEVSRLWEEILDGNETLPLKLERMEKSLNEALSGVENLEILLSAWKPNPQKLSQVLYLKSTGLGRALLFREGSLINLTSPQSQGQLISGYLEEGDRLLLISSSLGRILSDEQTLGLIKASSESLEEEINPLILEIDRPEPVAAILVDSQKEQTEEIGDVSEILETPNTMESAPSEVLSRRLDLSPVLERIKPLLGNRRIRLGLIILALIIVVLGVFKFTSHKVNSEKDAKFESYISSAQNEYNQALAAKDTDTNSAKNDLDSAQKDLALAESINPNDQRVKSLKSQIDANSDQILKVYSISSWPTFLDLNLIKPGFNASGMTYSVGKIVLFDTNQKSLVEIDLQKKDTKILAGASQMGNVTKASLNGDFAFSYSVDKGVVRIDANSNQATPAVAPDSDWGKIEDLTGFGGNIYLLDTIKNQIWKYIPAGNGYSDKATYLKGNNGVDFSGAKKMLIDSSVYILKSPAEIDRYTAGVPDNFSIGGLDKNINNISTFFVSSDTSNFYLVDPDNSRMLILQKDGSYISQIHSDEFKKATDLVVTEDDKKIYLLEGNKIVTASLP